MLGLFRYTIPGRLRRHADLLTAVSHQAVLSSANFGGQMLYARYLAPAEFGRLRLLLSIFYVALGAMNAIILEPFILNHAAPGFHRAGHDYLNKLSILCFGLAMATGLGALLVAVIVPRSGVLLISGLVTALYSFVHFTLWLLRWYFSAKSDLIRILWFDTAYLILTVAGCATTVFAGLRSAEWAMTALGIGGLPVVLAALATTRDVRIVRLKWARVLAAHYATARYYLVIAFASGATGQMQTWLSAGLLGLNATAVVGILNNSLAPCSQAINGLVRFFLPRMSSACAQDRLAEADAVMAKSLIVLGGIGSIYGCLVWFLGDVLIGIVGGRQYSSYAPFMKVAGIASVLTGFTASFTMYAKARNGGRQLMSAALIASIIMPLLSWGLISRDGLRGAAMTLIAANGLALAASIWASHMVRRAFARQRLYTGEEA
jgi:O-antigen/teichoic acid export membrane protein